jgi:hypothetical protein
MHREVAALREILPQQPVGRGCWRALGNVPRRAVALVAYAPSAAWPARGRSEPRGTGRTPTRSPPIGSS